MTCLSGLLEFVGASVDQNHIKVDDLVVEPLPWLELDHVFVCYRATGDLRDGTPLFEQLLDPLDEIFR